MLSNILCQTTKLGINFHRRPPNSEAKESGSRIKALHEYADAATHEGLQLNALSDDGPDLAYGPQTSRLKVIWSLSA